MVTLKSEVWVHQTNAISLTYEMAGKNQNKLDQINKRGDELRVLWDCEMSTSGVGGRPIEQPDLNVCGKSVIGSKSVQRYEPPETSRRSRGKRVAPGQALTSRR